MKAWSFILWWAALPLQAVLLILMLRNRAYRHFPWFFTYNAYSVGTSCLRYAFSQNEVVYPYLYWISDGVYAVLGIIVMYEVVLTMLRGLARLLWLRAIFVMTVLFTLGLTLWMTRTVSSNMAQVMVFVIGAEMCARIIEVAMFVLLMLLVWILGFRWRHHAFGICAGFGIYSSCALLVSTKFYEFGTRFTFLWSIVSVVSYTVAILIWLWYFSTPIAAETPRKTGPPLSLEDLERYKQIVRKTPRP